MTESQRFKSVWEALEDSPEQAENMKLHAELIRAIRDRVESPGPTQQQPQLGSPSLDRTGFSGDGS